MDAATFDRVSRAAVAQPVRREGKTAIVLLVLSIAAGCGPPPRPVHLSPFGPPTFDELSRSVEGRPIHRIVLGSGAETVILVGVIHGDEPGGARLLRRFVRHLEEKRHQLDGRRVVVVPVLNPDGLARGSRWNARGVDVNRNFPAANWRPGPRHGREPGSEPETVAFLGLLEEFRPLRILQIHSSLRCINYDGPALEVARDMALASGYPLRPWIGYPTPGSLGSYAGGDREIPTVTLELDPLPDDEMLWSQLAGALEVFVTSNGTGGLGHSIR